MRYYPPAPTGCRQGSSNAILQQPGTQPAGQPASRVAGSAGQPDSRSARQPASQRQRALFTKIPLTLRSRVPSEHPLLFAAVPAATFLASPRVSDTGIRPLRGSTGGPRSRANFGGSAVHISATQMTTTSVPSANWGGDPSSKSDFLTFVQMAVIPLGHFA